MSAPADQPEELFKPVLSSPNRRFRHSTASKPMHQNPGFQTMVQPFLRRLIALKHPLMPAANEIMLRVSFKTQQKGCVGILDHIAYVLRLAHLKFTPYLVKKMEDGYFPCCSSLWPTFIKTTHVSKLKEEVWYFLLPFALEYHTESQSLCYKTFEKMKIRTIAAAHIALIQHYDSVTIRDASFLLFNTVRGQIPLTPSVPSSSVRSSVPNSSVQPPVPSVISQRPELARRIEVERQFHNLAEALVEIDSLKKSLEKTSSDKAKHKFNAQVWHSHHTDLKSSKDKEISDLKGDIRRLRDQVNTLQRANDRLQQSIRATPSSSGTTVPPIARAHDLFQAQSITLNISTGSTL